MLPIVKSLMLDVSEQNRIQAIVAKQYDKNSRFLKIQLRNEGVPLVIDQASTVTINALRADGASKAFLGEVNNDGTITVPITYWMLELDDNVSCDISVIDDQDRKLTTLGFNVEVDRANYLGNEISEDGDIDTLTIVIKKAKEAVASAKEASEALSGIQDIIAQIEALPILTGTEDPLPSTAAEVNQFYFNTTTRALFYCESVDYTETSSEIRTWKMIAANIPVIDSPPTSVSIMSAGQAFIEQRTGKFYIAALESESGSNIVWKEVLFSEDIENLVSSMLDDNTLDKTHTWSGAKVQQQIGSVADTLSQGMTGMGNAFSAQLNELRANKENISNKIDSITSQSTNTQYPSAKAVYDTVKVLEGIEAPTVLTVGEIGQKYKDTTTGKVYLCVEIKKYTDPVERILYSWMPLFVPDDDEDSIKNLYLPIGQLMWIRMGSAAGKELCKVASRDRSSIGTFDYTIETQFIANSTMPDSGNYFEKTTLGEQLQELGAKKVNRTTGVKKVYITDTDGETTTTLSYDEEPTAHTFPLRDENGNIKVGLPANDNDAVPLMLLNDSLNATKLTTNPNTAEMAGHVGSLCLVGSSDFSPFDVYICVHADDEQNQYVWHKMCTTEAPS